MKPAKRKPPVRDISGDGQLEVRGNKIIIYEPLKSEIEELCGQRKISAQKYWDDLYAAALKEAKAAKVKQPKTSREKHAEEML